MAGMAGFAAQISSRMGEDEDDSKLAKFNRARSKTAKLMHSHPALIVVSVLAIIDAALVVSQLITDLIIIRQIMDHNVENVATIANILPEKLPVEFHCYNHTEGKTMDDIIKLLHGNNDTDGGHHRRKRETYQFSPILEYTPDMDQETIGKLCSSYGISVFAETNARDPHDPPKQRSVLFSLKDLLLPRLDLARSKRGTNGDTHISDGDTHAIGNGSCPPEPHHEEHGHGLLHSLTHYLHLSSLAVLSVMVLEKLVRIASMGKHFFKYKLQVFDTFVVGLSWLLDIILIDGLWSKSETDAALLLIILLPWRVIRIVNCFVMTFKERYKIRIKMLEAKARQAERKAEASDKQAERLKKELKMLRELAKKQGATIEDIKACEEKANDSLRRKKSMYLNSLASMTALLGATIQGESRSVSRSVSRSNSDTDIKAKDDDSTHSDDGNKTKLVNGMPTEQNPSKSKRKGDSVAGQPKSADKLHDDFLKKIGILTGSLIPAMSMGSHQNEQGSNKGDNSSADAGMLTTIPTTLSRSSSEIDQRNNSTQFVIINEENAEKDNTEKAFNDDKNCNGIIMKYNNSDAQKTNWPLDADSEKTDVKVQIEDLVKEDASPLASLEDTLTRIDIEENTQNDQFTKQIKDNLSADTDSGMDSTTSQGEGENRDCSSLTNASDPIDDIGDGKIDKNDRYDKTYVDIDPQKDKPVDLDNDLELQSHEAREETNVNVIDTSTPGDNSVIDKYAGVPLNSSQERNDIIPDADNNELNQLKLADSTVMGYSVDNEVAGEEGAGPSDDSGTPPTDADKDDCVNMNIDAEQDNIITDNSDSFV